MKLSLALAVSILFIGQLACADTPKLIPAGKIITTPQVRLRAPAVKTDYTKMDKAGPVP